MIAIIVPVILTHRTDTLMWMLTETMYVQPIFMPCSPMRLGHVQAVTSTFTHTSPLSCPQLRGYVSLPFLHNKR